MSSLIKEGKILSILFTATNNGSGLAINAKGTFTLPDGVTLVGGTPSKGSLDIPGKVWNIGTQTSGESNQIDLQVRIDDSCKVPLDVTMTLTSDTSDPNATNNIISKRIEGITACDVLSALGGALGPLGSNVLYVSKGSGNNDTAEKGNHHLPWADPWTAQDNAVAGDWIYVIDGNWTIGDTSSGEDVEGSDKIFDADDLNFFWGHSTGVTDNRTDTDNAEIFLYADKTANIRGYGEFSKNESGSATVTGKATVNISGDSDVFFEAKSFMGKSRHILGVTDSATEATIRVSVDYFNHDDFIGFYFQGQNTFVSFDAKKYVSMENSADGDNAWNVIRLGPVTDSSIRINLEQVVANNMVSTIGLTGDVSGSDIVATIEQRTANVTDVAYSALTTQYSGTPGNGGTWSSIFRLQGGISNSSVILKCVQSEGNGGAFHSWDQTGGVWSNSDVIVDVNHKSSDSICIIVEGDTSNILFKGSYQSPVGVVNHKDTTAKPGVFYSGKYQSTGAVIPIAVQADINLVNAVVLTTGANGVEGDQGPGASNLNSVGSGGVVEGAGITVVGDYQTVAFA